MVIAVVVVVVDDIFIEYPIPISNFMLEIYIQSLLPDAVLLIMASPVISLTPIIFLYL